MAISLSKASEITAIFFNNHGFDLNLIKSTNKTGVIKSLSRRNVKQAAKIVDSKEIDGLDMTFCNYEFNTDFASLMNFAYNEIYNTQSNPLFRFDILGLGVYANYQDHTDCLYMMITSYTDEYILAGQCEW